MRDLRCGCGQPVQKNHRCRATVIADPPTPFNRKEFEQIMRDAQAEARAQAAADAQAALPLVLDLDEVDQ